MGECASGMIFNERCPLVLVWKIYRRAEGSIPRAVLRERFHEPKKTESFGLIRVPFRPEAIAQSFTLQLDS